MIESIIQSFKLFMYSIGVFFATLAMVGCSDTQDGPELQSFMSNDDTVSVSDESDTENVISSNDIIESSSAEDPAPEGVMSSEDGGTSDALNQSSDQSSAVSSIIGEGAPLGSSTSSAIESSAQSSTTHQRSSDASGNLNESSPTVTGWTPYTPRENAHSIIGYYAGWQWYDRSQKAAPENLDFSKWTRVNYAFFHPADDGTLHVTDDWADPQVLFGPTNWNPSADDSEICISAMSKGGVSGSAVCGFYDRTNGLIELAHAAGTEIWPSIGGWTLSETFPAIAASPIARASFASECVRLLREYNMDGIDIDWEYPGYAAHGGTDADKVNYVVFMKEIKDSIMAYGETRSPQRTYGITAALPCGTSILEKGIDVAALVEILDEFNLMTYDFHGAFEIKVDHNSPLYATNVYPETPRFSVDGCVQNYMERGAPAEILNVGAGFYGRSYAGATDLGGTHDGNDAAHWATDEGMPMYYNIVTALAGGTLVKHFDAVAKVPYGILTGGGIVSYEDEESMAIKAQYINDKSLRGVIVWEMSGDVMEDGSTPLSDVLDAQLSR